MDTILFFTITGYGFLMTPIVYIIGYVELHKKVMHYGTEKPDEVMERKLHNKKGHCMGCRECAGNYYYRTLLVRRPDRRNDDGNCRSLYRLSFGGRSTGFVSFQPIQSNGFSKTAQLHTRLVTILN